MDRVLQSWGVDGHNSHTNVCSGAARLGYVLWAGGDRPSPDHANAKFILLLSSHLETGHYFNPHAQRIIEAKMAGAKIATVDVRLSNTASMSDYWISPRPGTEAAMLLGYVRVLLNEGFVNRDFVESWFNWEAFLDARYPDDDRTVDQFLERLKEIYDSFTPEWVAAECDINADTVVEVAREIGKAGSAFSSHVWRNAASGNRGGWQVARCLQFISALTGSIGTKGGTALASTNKFVAAPFKKPSPQKVWSELLYPVEWPLSHHELSFCLPHLEREGRGKIDTYFTRVYNPVWTNPDGFSWIEMLKDEERVGLHIALTPTLSETTLFADYVLPMGLATERHDLMSQETHAGRWIGFRQPVQRVLAERNGEAVRWTYETNPGEVWEEDEFWIALSWAIDTDGSLGIRENFESPYRAGECITIDEYYQWIFENSVPGLPDAAAAEGLSPLEYMRHYGAFEVDAELLEPHKNEVSAEGAECGEDGLWRRDGAVIGVDRGGVPQAGFGTPSRKLEFYSPTMEEWGFGDQALPGYIRSHVHVDELEDAPNAFALVPTFRLPTLIHSRSANSKWLCELSNTNPVWINVADAKRLEISDGDLVAVKTRIGRFVNRAWVTEGIRPGVVACSHHLGRWRTPDGGGTDRWGAATVNFKGDGDGKWSLSRHEDIGPFDSSDADSDAVWWNAGGVHQNLTFAAQPDPISGMHCWHQSVLVEKATPDDTYGDVQVDTEAAHTAYKEWQASTPVCTYPDGMRRPFWFARAVKPHPDAYRLP
jgi:anaerobic selenocysteine-containing dehydrogenase